MGSYHLDKPVKLLLSVLLFPLRRLENQTLTIPGIGLNGLYSFFLDKTSTSMSKLIFLILDPYLFQLLPYPSLHIKQPSKLRFDQEGPPFGYQLPHLIFFPIQYYYVLFCHLNLCMPSLNTYPRPTPKLAE